MTEVTIRSWRIIPAAPSGAFLWFDPSREIPSLVAKDPPTESGVGACREGDEPDDQVEAFQVTPIVLHDDGLPF